MSWPTIVSMHENSQKKWVRNSGRGVGGTKVLTIISSHGGAPWEMGRLLVADHKPPPPCNGAAGRIFSARREATRATMRRLPSPQKRATSPFPSPVAGCAQNLPKQPLSSRYLSE